MNNSVMRKELGDYNSIVCFRAVITGLESVMGTEAARGNLIRAGCIRGLQVIQDLGLNHTDKPIDEWSALVAAAVGEKGTRLCIIERLEEKDGVYHAYLSDTICSAGEEQDSERKLSFTQGAVQGTIEGATGHRLSGVQIGSVLRGDDYDIVEYKIRKHFSRPS